MAVPYNEQKTWVLINTEDPKQPAIKGQFEAQDLTGGEVVNNWAEHTSLNRSQGILQFVNKQSERFAFEAVMFAETSADDVVPDLAALKELGEPVAKLGNRPPIISFSVGDGSIFMEKCVVDSITSIRYGKLTSTGGVREIRCTISLRAYYEFSLDEELVTDTRYHRAKEDEYFEWIAASEYGEPMLGDVIRSRHPATSVLSDGDVVKLPAIEGVRNEAKGPRSVPLKTAFGKKDTEQRRRREEIFDSRNVEQTSHVLVGE